jgi:hypothetical protein
MQQKYLGDCHDFLKYALLRRLHQTTGMRLGVNWYLTDSEAVDPPGNNDGQNRQYLQDSKRNKWKMWQQVDPDLFKQIQHFENKDQRLLANVGAWGLLPADTIYFEQSVGADRKAWHARALESLRDADIVFLDPDNGFEVKSVKGVKLSKYVMYDEIKPYLDRDQAVVAIQFVRQCKAEDRVQKIRERVELDCCKAAPLPVVRGRVGPNILFFSVAPAGKHAAIRQALLEFVDSGYKVEVIP